MIKNLTKRALKKAAKSKCKYKVAALALDKRGKFIGSAFNVQRFNREGGTIHAEMNLMRKYGPKIKTIIICRVSGRNGNIVKKIHPCDTCLKKANEYGIKIISLDFPL